MLVAGFLLFILGLLFTGLSPWIWLLAIAMTALAVGSWFINPVTWSSISLALTPAHEQGGGARRESVARRAGADFRTTPWGAMPICT